MAPSDFGRSVNPNSTKGGRLCPLNDTGTPGFSDLPTALSCKVKKSYTYGSKHFLAPFYKGPTNASKISFKYSGIESEAKKK